jgi:hypothetical protein
MGAGVFAVYHSASVKGGEHIILGGEVMSFSPGFSFLQARKIIREKKIGANFISILDFTNYDFGFNDLRFWNF